MGHRPISRRLIIRQTFVGASSLAPPRSQPSLRSVAPRANFTGEPEGANSDQFDIKIHQIDELSDP